MSSAVVFSPEVEEQLAELYRCITAAALPEVAARYSEAVISYCESLRTFPLRGTMRADVRLGLRYGELQAQRLPSTDKLISPASTRPFRRRAAA